VTLEEAMMEDKGKVETRMGRCRASR